MTRKALFAQLLAGTCLAGAASAQTEIGMWYHGAGNEALLFPAEQGVAFAGSNLQDLEEGLVAVLLDLPIVQPAAGFDGLGVNPEFRRA